MMDLDSLIPIFGILLVMIPVAGLTLVLTLRLAVKPFVETLADALRDSRPLPDRDAVGAHLEDLRHQIDSLSREVRELRSETAFSRTLSSGPSEEARTEA